MSASRISRAGLDLLSRRQFLGHTGAGLGGTASFYLPMARQMLAEVAENVVVRPIEDSGHWIAEEQPETFLRCLRDFIQTSGGS